MAESWWFDFAAADTSLGGFARLVLDAERGAAWFWAALVGDGRPYLLVRDEDVPLPRPGAIEVRAEGLWSAFECEEPFEHWTIGLEAFAVALDDPDEAWAGERGDVVGLGFDLEWETTEPPTPISSRSGVRDRDQRDEMADAEAAAGAKGGYGQGCVVHGQILVGPTERLEFAGTGWRSHTWGVLTEAVPQPPATPAGEARLRAPLLAGGRRAEYLLGVTSGRAAWWRAPDHD